MSTESGTSSESLSAVLHARHRATIGTARPEAMLAVADELAALAAATGRGEDAAWASLWRLDAHCRAGARPELDAELTALAALAGSLDSPAWHWRLAAARTTLAAIDGDEADASARADEALRVGEAAGIGDALPVDRLVRLSLAVRTGAGLDAVERGLHRETDGTLAAMGGRALVLLALGRVDDALAGWAAIAPRLPKLPRDTPGWLVATAGFATLCTAADDTASAQYLVEALAPYAGQHVSAGVLTPYEGPVDLVLGGLAVTLGDRTAARKYFGAGLQLSERMRAPHFAHRARSALDALSGRFGPLTAREADIARLVAGGMTNRQIATRLYLSEPAVENHVRHIQRKLDASSRAEIADKAAGR